ncbi:MAG TPA: tetratricopeptide repeat protein [Roseiflexaceae bacterium]|nr:tetratricopeptide repeat protein [Roseiflexaceae bacterium]
MDQPGFEQTPSDAAARAPARPPHNLPAALTPFVGRDTECAQVTARLRQQNTRLLTITGAGGVGKTRLALEAALSLIPAPGVETPFAHGVCLAPLATLGEHETLADVLATTLVSALGIALAGPESPAAQVIQYLREKAILLLVDNLEHVAGGVAFITSLLQAAPALTIVVTTRQRLNMRGEQVMELAGLPFPAPGQVPGLEALARYDAIELFVQSAQALQPDFALSAETGPAVARICQLVEGLPLGIELAAAWIRVLSCDEIAQEIARNLDFLSSAMQDLPVRQRSLRAVFDYSWNLLSAPEQQALRQLAVFRGSFTREAETAVLSSELRVQSSEPNMAQLRTQNSELLTLLAALVDKSLVRRVTTEGLPRYVILELLRQYLAEHLARAGEAEAAAARHSAYYSGWLGGRTGELRGKEQGAALAAIDREIEQIRAAWRCAVTTADSAALGNAADSLFHFYDMRSWFHEGAEAFGLASQALAACQGAADQLVYGKLLARLAWFTFYLGHQAEAKTLFEQSLAILRQLDARADMVFTLNYLGAVCSYLGDYAQTRALCREALSIAESLGDDYGRAIACNILGQTAYECGDYTEAQAWSQRSFALEQQIGNGWSMAFSLTNLGKVAYALGEYAEARWFFEQSLQTRENLGDTRGVAICYNRLGDAAMALGSLAEAGQRYAQSLMLLREIGNQWGMAESLINLGQLASTQSHDPAATCLLQEALRLALGTQSVPQVVTIMAAFAPIVRRAGQAAWADELAQFVAAEPVSFDSYRPHAERLLGWAAPGSVAPTLEQAIAAAQAPPRPVERAAPAAAGESRRMEGSAATPAGHPAGLTAREIAVLRLVAQGLTDAQVAEKLVLSPRTVSTHLTSIYGKLQVNSRSAATRFAVENGVV